MMRINKSHLRFLILIFVILNIAGCTRISSNNSARVQIKLCPTEFNTQEVAWSPDGVQIAYTSRNSRGEDEIVILNLDGGMTGHIRDLPVISDPEPDSSWSANGTQLIIESLGYSESSQKVSNDLLIVNADGSSNRVLLSTLPPATLGYGDFSWSPDSSQFVYGLYSGQGLYLKSINGDSSTLLIDRPENEIAPSWSPDSKQIAFFLGQDFYFQPAFIEPDGTNVRLIGDKYAVSSTPLWSPDSTRLAFKTATSFNERKEEHLYVIDATSAEPILITTNATGSFQWMPDGEQIAYLTFDNYIEISRADGSGIVRKVTFPNGESMYGNGDFSPDGTKFAYVSDQGGNGEVYVFDIVNGETTRLTSNPNQLCIK
jgi:Tol biopolymer transport system component